MKRPAIAALFLVFVPFLLSSQTFQRIDAPVSKNGTPLNSAWAGGISAPQWSKVDLNGDGKMDLYEFDRDGFIHVPFLNVGNAGESKYAFAPEFSPYFPPTWNYVLLRDYNQDGVMDFFGHANDEGIPGIKVYKGQIVDGHLEFEREEFTHYSADVITVPTNNGGYANLQAASVDYPAIDDIDGDGDLDVVEMEIVSGLPANRIIFYKNLALEQGFTTDTLIFKKEDACWLKVYLPSVDTKFIFSGDPDTCAADMFAPKFPDLEKGGLHGASSLCTFDADNDGDKELLYGDINFSTIRFAKNNGTPSNGWATEQDTIFPNYNASIEMPDFPATFYLDFDNDGLNDLLVVPNDVLRGPDQEVWFYKNTNSSEVPLFNMSSKFAVVDNMIDLGTTAQPAFFDYNGDGLMDFVCGNFETKMTDNLAERASSLFLFENVGTATAPAFELVDEDWLNFKQYSLLPDNLRRFGFAPAFGDLDQDGDDDLLVGEQAGFIYFVENTAGMGNPPVWGTVMPNWKNIDVGVYSTPCIYDLNKDGLTDLLIGERNGNINYLQNIGTEGNPDFNPELDVAPNNMKIGDISTIQSPLNGFSAPVILDFVDSVFLLTGSEVGFIEMYKVDENKLEFGDTFDLVTKQLAGLRTGTHSRISFADINDDNILDALIGNHRGGLGLYTSPFSIDGSVETTSILADTEFDVYPNPASELLHVSISPEVIGKGRFYLYNAVGQQVKAGILESHDLDILINDFAPGFYFLQLKIGERTGVTKVIIQ